MKYFIYCRKSTEDAGKQIQSVEDQERILRGIASKRGLDVAQVFKESKSAKAPGREAFNQMITQINQGKAQGVLCWKLDRLARNPLDGGTINWMLQQGVIQKIITNDRDYNPGDNVLMMSVEFGMANQFVRDLGKNTKRGMKTKCEKGWLPSLAPMGYLNDNSHSQGDRTIIKDELRFPLVRKMWYLMLTGEYSIRKICDIANKDWGLRSVKRRSIGGVKVAISTLYQIFTNPFYYGEFDWDGQTYKGRHDPMITKDEFDRVQRLLGGKDKPRAAKIKSAYTGLIKCGECGFNVTVERKAKYNKASNKVKSYTYYHCTHKRKDYDCRQGSIEERKLESQVNLFLDNMTIEDEFIDWIIEYFHEFSDKEAIDRKSISENLKKQLSVCEGKIDKLIELKISDLLTDQEFKDKKDSLVIEKEGLLREMESASHRQDSWIDTVERSCNFIRSVKQRFNEGSHEDKRLILSTVGSNLLLKDGIVSLEASGIFNPLSKGILDTKKSGIRLEQTKGSLNKTKKASNEALRSMWYPR